MLLNKILLFYLIYFIFIGHNMSATETLNNESVNLNPETKENIEINESVDPNLLETFDAINADQENQGSANTEEIPLNPTEETIVPPVNTEL